MMPAYIGTEMLDKFGYYWKAGASQPSRSFERIFITDGTVPFRDRLINPLGYNTSRAIVNFDPVGGRHGSIISYNSVTERDIAS